MNANQLEKVSSNQSENEINESRIEISGKNNRKNECIIKGSPPFEKIDRIIAYVSKSICKVIIKKESFYSQGTGFLLAIWIDDERFFCLVSNEHVIQKKFLNDEYIIKISYDNEFITKYIDLNNNKRYMRSFTNIGIDLTIVQILEEDNISKDYFLYPDEQNINNELINSSIYIPQFPGGKQLMNAKGKIKEIKKNEFAHLANTEQGSSGSPIFLENSIYVIGIHKAENTDSTENYGDFIYPAINIIKVDIRKKEIMENI